MSPHDPGGALEYALNLTGSSYAEKLYPVDVKGISGFVSRGLMDGITQSNETVGPGPEEIELPTISVLRAKPGSMSF